MWAQKLIDFYLNLDLEVPLPPGFRVMNPFKDSPLARKTVELFYEKYYGDKGPRKIILGINPGRHGGGITGIPFTDTKRLLGDCEIPFDGPLTHEPSSVFIYEVIRAMGGPAKFYRDYLIFPASPLGFLREKAPNRWVNANYYDDPQLFTVLQPFICNSIEKVLTWGAERTFAVSLGTGLNFKHLKIMNEREKWFQHLIPMEHPRYIIQYRTKEISLFVEKYREALNSI